MVSNVEQTMPEAEEADLRLGRRIRALRLERGLSLVEVAQRAGLSVGALSQIERGLSSLRVKARWPLAGALDIEPHRLIADDDAVGDLYVVRSAARKNLPVRSDGMTKQLLSPPGSSLTGLMVRVEPGGGTAGAYHHAGHEFGVVASGEVELTIDNVVYRLKAGDSFAFRSTLDHAFRNVGGGACEIVWVNTVRPADQGGPR